MPIEKGLYVGDGENDILAAHAAGMRAVGVGFGFHPRECKAESPEYFVDSYEELVTRWSPRCAGRRRAWPLQTGARFSTNASAPSLASSD